MTRTSSLFLTILPLLLGFLPRSHQPPNKRDRPSGPVFPSPNIAIARGWRPTVYISQPSPPGRFFSRIGEWLPFHFLLSHFASEFSRSNACARPPVSTAHIPNFEFEFPATHHRIRLLARSGHYSQACRRHCTVARAALDFHSHSKRVITAFAIYFVTRSHRSTCLRNFFCAAHLTLRLSTVTCIITNCCRPQPI